MKKNFIIFCGVFTLLMLIFSTGTLYACDTTLCKMEANQQAKQVCTDRGLEGGYAVPYGNYCEMGVCKSGWILMAGDEHQPEPGGNAFVDFWDCSNDAWECQTWDGGGDGGGGGNEGSECEIGLFEECPMSCPICTRNPFMI